MHRQRTVPARLRRDRVEKMRREMKLTPQPFSFLALPPPPSAAAAAPVKYTVDCGHAVTPAFVSLYFHPLVSAVIHCSLALTVCSTARSLPFPVHTNTRTHADAFLDIFQFRALRLSSCCSFPPPPPATSSSSASSSLQQQKLQQLKSWMYWHVSFHHPNCR